MQSIYKALTLMSLISHDSLIIHVKLHVHERPFAIYAPLCVFVIGSVVCACSMCTVIVNFEWVQWFNLSDCVYVHVYNGLIGRSCTCRRGVSSAPTVLKLSPILLCVHWDCHHDGSWFVVIQMYLHYHQFLNIIYRVHAAWMASLCIFIYHDGDT